MQVEFKKPARQKTRIQWSYNYMHPSEKCQRANTLVCDLPEAWNSNIDHRSYQAIQTEHTPHLDNNPFKI